MIKSRRIGRFYLSMAFFENLCTGEGANIFKDMVVLQAQHNFAADRIEYVAIHRDFEQLPEGCEAPLYTATFTSDSIYPTWARSP